MGRLSHKEKNKRRTETVSFKVTPEEFKIIEAHANKEGISVSQLGRSNLFMGMLMDGNVDVFKLLIEMSKDEVKEAFAETVNAMRDLIAA